MFVNDVDCKTDILDHLYGTGVLDTEEKEEVGCLSHTRHESNRILLNKLVRKGEDAYKHLVEALGHGQYNDVAFEMENNQVSELDIQLCQIGIFLLLILSTSCYQLIVTYCNIHLHLNAVIIKHRGNGAIPRRWNFYCKYNNKLCIFQTANCIICERFNFNSYIKKKMGHICKRDNCSQETK